MKITIDPYGLVDFLPPGVGVARETIQQIDTTHEPPLYVDSQINLNPLWVVWCMAKHNVSHETAEKMGNEKGIFGGRYNHVKTNTLDAILWMAAHRFSRDMKQEIKV